MRTIAFILFATLSSWVALTAGARAAATAARCAPVLNGRALGQVSLFDGPVSEGADLAPDSSAGHRNTWTHLGQAGRPVFLVCRYAGGPEPVPVALPPGVSRYTGTLSRDGRSYRAFACRR